MSKYETWKIWLPLKNLHASCQIQSNQVETVCEILGHKLV